MDKRERKVPDPDKVSLQRSRRPSERSGPPLQTERTNRNAELLASADQFLHCTREGLRG